MNEIVGVITVIMTIAISFLYILDTIKGKIKPHPFSWLLWSIIMSIIFLAQVSDNAGPGAWASGTVAVMNFSIFLLSLKNGVGLIKKSDVIVLIIAFVAIALWVLTSNPLWSVIILSVINTLAFFSTYRKSAQKPFEEPLYLYVIHSFRQGLSIVAIANYSAVTVLGPAVSLLNNVAISFYLFYRRRAVQIDKG